MDGEPQFVFAKEVENIVVAFECWEGELGVDLKEKCIFRTAIARCQFREREFRLKIIGCNWELRLTGKRSIAVFRKENKGWVAFGEG